MMRKPRWRAWGFTQRRANQSVLGKSKRQQNTRKGRRKGEERRRRKGAETERHWRGFHQRGHVGPAKCLLGKAETHELKMSQPRGKASRQAAAVPSPEHGMRLITAGGVGR